jgi:Domain of unknown function (DUF4062)
MTFLIFVGCTGASYLLRRHDARGDRKMFRANVLKVMIASPGDVTEERKAVTEAIYSWNDANASARGLVLLPVKWETHSTPQMGGHPQEIINRQLLDDADIVIGIFGTRIGTPTPDYVSGTVEEIKRHVAAGKSAKVYFSDVPIPPSEINGKQLELVQAFRIECGSTGLYATFSSIHEFSRNVRHHLDIELNQPRFRWLTAPSTPDSGATSLTPDAIRLLTAMAATGDGVAILQETLSGCGLRIGSEEFMDGTARSAAQWRAALTELEAAGALELAEKGIYRVTAVGYQTAELNGGLAASKVNAFDAHKDARTSQLLKSFSCRQRDMLRLLLLQGGSARGDVIHRAWVNKSIGFDWNGLTKQLIESGVMTVVENRTSGHATLFVNESMTNSVKKLLFPRDEGSNGSDFANV